MKRNILLHCHFFKNAGSSVDWALRRTFGSGFYENKQHFYSVFDWNDYLVKLLKKQDKVAVSSHIFSLRPPVVEGVTIHPISLMRHPIERVTSVVSYEKKQNYKNSLGTITDVNIGIRDYVAAYLKKGTPASIRNMHTLRFAGRDNGLPVTEEDFAKALDTLERCKTIGLVASFDASMVLFEEVLRPIFPKLDLAYIPQNVQQELKSQEMRILELQKQLGEDLFSELCEKNEYDLRLHEAVKNELATRTKSIEDFDRKLLLFQERCAKLCPEEE